MKLYLEITQDKYELPLAVADSIPELEQMRGTCHGTVRTYLSNMKHGKVKSKYKKYITVEVDDDY